MLDKELRDMGEPRFANQFRDYWASGKARRWVNGFGTPGVINV
jgi:hypothetical protein